MEKLIPWIWWVESVIVDSLSPFSTRHRISHLEHLNVLWEQINNCSWVSCLWHNGEDTVKHYMIDRKDHGFNLKWSPTIVNGPINTICSSKESSHYCSSEWSRFSPMTAEGKMQWEAFGELMVVCKADDSSVDNTGLWTPSCWSAEGLLRPEAIWDQSKTKPRTSGPSPPQLPTQNTCKQMFLPRSNVMTHVYSSNFKQYFYSVYPSTIPMKPFK